MTLDREIVGKFIDAAVNDASTALRLLSEFPALRNAHWNLGQTSLHFLAVEGFTAAVELCLCNGFNPNATNEFGDTPLTDACVLGNVDIVRLLLAHGANPDVTSDTKDCPLHSCIRNGDADLLDLLLDAGSNPYYTTDLGETIFDNWPNTSEKQRSLSLVLSKHGIQQHAT